MVAVNRNKAGPPKGGTTIHKKGASKRWEKTQAKKKERRIHTDHYT
jgi:hypothetical protein